MPVRPLRQKPKVRTYSVRARLGHQWMTDDDGTPHPGPRVTDHEKFALGAANGIRCYVGYVFDRNMAIPGESEGGWRPVVEPEEVPQRHEYLQALAHGDLWPADEATAKAASDYARALGLPAIKFDPLYNGELAELVAWLSECEDEVASKVANSKPVEVKKPVVTPPALNVPSTEEKVQ